jgi:cell division septation protein DedD
MRGRFDDEDETAERQRPSRDTELTLGTGTLLLLFLGLALICGACFGLGYEVGRGVNQPSAQGQQGAGAGQTGLPSNGVKAKPSATETPVPPAPSPSVVVENNHAGSESPPSKQTASPSVTQTTAAPQPQVRAALPAYNAPLPSGDSGMHAVLPPPMQLMVQIAAVSHQEDADVLSAALRKHGYAVVERREGGDGLIHVRIGPFSSRDEAEHWRQKLLDDGYNAMIQ